MAPVPVLEVLSGVQRMGAARCREDAGLELLRSIVGLTGAAQGRLDQLVQAEGLTRLLPLAEAFGAHARVIPACEFSLDSLPALESSPGFAACVADGRPVASVSPAGLHRYLFPVVAGGRPEAIVSVGGLAPLAETHLPVVGEMAAVYGGHVATLDYGQRDALTGLYNRRSFDDQFSPARGLPPRGERWLGVVDIDHFKRVNDRFGHLYGDEVLLLVAQALQSGVRPLDRVFRFGGEEFVVLLEGVGHGDGPDIFERLRARIESREVPQVGRVTVSIGCTPMAREDLPNDAFGRADAALYRAKQGGRNRVVRHVPAGSGAPARVASDRAELF